MPNALPILLASTAAASSTGEPTTFEVVFPLTILLFLGLLVPAFMVGLNWFLHAHKPKLPSTDEPYECGLSVTVGSAEERFSVKFYLIAMLFLAFDLEVAFLYPWAIGFRQGGWPMFWLLVVFLVMLEAGYLYLWRKGALDWDK